MRSTTHKRNSRILAIIFILIAMLSPIVGYFSAKAIGENVLRHTTAAPESRAQNVATNRTESRDSSEPDRTRNKENALKTAAKNIVQQPSQPSQNQIVTFSVKTAGSVSSDVNEFANNAVETLNDRRSWSQLGLRFERVDSGGDFTLYLASSDQMTSFSIGCSAEWSCRVGDNVIINQDRWAETSASWSAAGGSPREYRHMVINHEVGHWLGLDHPDTTCNTQGSASSIMTQQSIDLGGCTFNAWPLKSDLYSPRYDIDLR